MSSRYRYQDYGDVEPRDRVDHKRGDDFRRDDFKDSSRRDDSSRREDLKRDRDYHRRYDDRRRRDYEDRGRRDEYRRGDGESREYRRGRDERSRSPRPSTGSRSSSNRLETSSNRGFDSRANRGFDSPTGNGDVVPLDQRERPLQNWDVAPAGFEKIRADIAKSTGIFPPPGNITKMANYVPPPLDPARAALLAALSAGGGGDLSAPPHHPHHHHPHSAYAKAGPNKERITRRVKLVGPGVKDLAIAVGKDGVAQLVDSFVKDLKASSDPSKLVESVNAAVIAPDSSFAMIEFFTQEDCQLCLENGHQLAAFVANQGHTIDAIMVERYDQEQTAETAAASKTGFNPLEQEDTSHRQLVLSGLPPALTPKHVRELLAPFGTITTFIYVKNHVDDAFLGTVVFEMEEDVLADVVLSAFSNESFSIGPHGLTVKRLTDYVDDADGQVRRLLSAFDLLPAEASGTASPVIQLLNVLEDSFDKPKVEAAVTDVCAQFGTVLKVAIPRDEHGTLGRWGRFPGQNRVFVQFASATEAVQAMRMLSGSAYNGRTVFCGFYPLGRFERMDF